MILEPLFHLTRNDRRRSESETKRSCLRDCGVVKMEPKVQLGCRFGMDAGRMRTRSRYFTVLYERGYGNCKMWWELTHL